MKKRSKKLLFVLVLAAAPVAQAMAVPYAKIVGMQLVFAAIPDAERDKLILQLKLIHADPANHAPIHAWVMDGPTRTDIPLTPDGTLPDSPRLDWIARNLDLQTDQPKGTLTTNITLLIRHPATPTFSAAYLLSGLKQAQNAIKTAARATGGYLATFATPKLTHIDLKLATCCAATATLTTPTSKSELKQDASGKIRFSLSLLETDPTADITIPAQIETIDPESD